MEKESIYTYIYIYIYIQRKSNTQADITRSFGCHVGTSHGEGRRADITLQGKSGDTKIEPLVQ